MSRWPDVQFDRINGVAPAAAAGDQIATDELVALCYDLVSWIRRQHGLYPPPGHTVEDMDQDGIIGVLEALRTWDQDIQPYFSNFVKMCVYRNMLETVKKGHRVKHKPLNLAVSLDVPVFPDRKGKVTMEDRVAGWRLPNQLGANPADILAERSAMRFLEAEVQAAATSDLERAALNLVIIGGQPYRAASQVINVSESSLDNACQRVRKKLRERLPELIADPRTPPETAHLLQEYLSIGKPNGRMRRGNSKGA